MTRCMWRISAMSEEEKIAQQKADTAIMQHAIDRMSEHFDSVQVFVSRYEPNQEGGTMSLHLGQGNWFARFGQVKEWVVKREENARIDCRRDNPL